MSDEIKFSDEAYQLLIRYEAARDQAVDCNTLALVLGTKYKSAWDKIARAKKSLTAAGIEVSAGAAGTPKKRKDEGNGVDGPPTDGGKKKTPTKPRVKKASKVGEEVNDEGSGSPQAKRVKKEEDDEE